MIIVTTDEVTGYRVEEVLGEVTGILAQSAIRFGGGWAALGGGEVTEYTQLLHACRNEAMNRLWMSANERGAGRHRRNAVRYASTIAESLLEVCAYGARRGTAAARGGRGRRHHPVDQAGRGNRRRGRPLRSSRHRRGARPPDGCRGRSPSSPADGTQRAPAADAPSAAPASGSLASAAGAARIPLNYGRAARGRWVGAVRDHPPGGGIGSTG